MCINVSMYQSRLAVTWNGCNNPHLRQIFSSCGIETWIWPGNLRVHNSFLWALVALAALRPVRLFIHSGH